MNINKLDQFYTNEKIAEKCIELFYKFVNVENYNYILEPSAGTGSFYNKLDKTKKIGLDIEPKCNDVLKIDFMNYVPEKNKTYCCIGNPPFGKNCSLAIQFFNKCATFSNYIGFIVPRTFKRVSVQNKLSLNFELIYNEDLPLKPCCFTPNMNAKCCFQIWKKIEIPRVIVVYDKIHKDFTFLKHGPKDINNQPTPPNNADFALKAYGANCGEIVDSNMNTLRPKSWHWIKSNINIDELKKNFKSLDYSMSKDTVRQDSLGQQELIYLYKLKYN